MAVNENIIHSLEWDLQGIVRVCGDISSWVGDVDCLSWRYPTLSCHTIDVLEIIKEETLSERDRYILLLELIYDRLHFLLNLLIAFVELAPPISNMFHLPSNVIRPKYLTVGAMINMYWKRILCLYKKLIQQLTDNINVGKKALAGVRNPLVMESRATQTNVHALTVCESCHLSETVVQRIIEVIEECKDTTQLTLAVVELRSQMRNDVFHITQWSAMERWVEAIEKDVKSLIKEIGNLQAENKHAKKKLKCQREAYDKEMSLNQNTIKNLQNEQCDLQSKLQKSELKCKEHITANHERKLKMQAYNNQINEMERRAKEFERDIHQLQESQKQSEAELKQSQVHLQDVTAELKTKTSELYEWQGKWTKEQQRCEDILRVSKEAETELTEQNVSLSQQVQQLSLKVAQLEDTLFNLQHKTVEEKQTQCVSSDIPSQSETDKLKKELQECKKRQQMLVDYPDPNNHVKTKLTGDPVKDMEGQLQANCLRIEVMTEQNARLRRTLEKLYQLSKN